MLIEGQVSNRSIHPGYFALGLIVVAVFLLAYQQTVVGLFGVWVQDGNPTYSHGPLLLITCLVLLYKRMQNAQLSFQLSGNYLPLITLACLSFLWFIAALGQIQIVQYLCLVFMVLNVYFVLFGFPTWRVFSVPVLLLLFALPFWEVFFGILQGLTVIGVEFLLRCSGIPVVVEGIFIQVPAGVFEVEEGCSGLGQFIVAAAIGVIFSDMQRLGLKKGVAVTLAAAAVALGSNILRVYIVVMAGQFTNMQHWLVKDHYTLGWVLFGILFFAFLYLLGRFVITEQPHAGEVLSGQNTKYPVGVNRENNKAKLSIAIAGFLCAALSGPVLLSYYDKAVAAEEVNFPGLPSTVNDWHAAGSDAVQWSAALSGYDAVERNNYRRHEHMVVNLQIYDYISQQQGKEAVGHQNNIYNRTDMSLQHFGVVPVENNLGAVTDMRELVLGDRSGQERLVWYWYQAAGRGTSNTFIIKLLGIWGRLIHKPVVSVVVIDMKIDDSLQQTRHAMRGFTEDLLRSGYLSSRSH